MKWTHISDAQPLDGSLIIYIDPPTEVYMGKSKKHYNMGMREFKPFKPWLEYTKWCDANNIKNDYWWIYAKDFTFPEIIVTQAT